MLSKEEKSNKIKQNYEKERMPFVWCVQAMGEGSTMTNALSKIDWSDSQFEGFDGEQATNYTIYRSIIVVKTFIPHNTTKNY